VAVEQEPWARASVPDDAVGAGTIPGPSVLADPWLVGGAAVLGVITLLALLAPVVAPYPPEAVELGARYQAPSLAHLMGTDALGRDVLSRALWASRISLTIGFVSVAVSTVMAVAIGLAAGALGGRRDDVLMRVTDVALVFPPLSLMIALVAALGHSILLLAVVIGVTSWPLGARIVRGETLALRGSDFVTASRLLGASDRWIMRRHLLPNVAWAVVVSATLRVPAAMLIEAGLSYLGLGVQAPEASWGNMVADGKSVLQIAWWVAVFPGLFILATVLASSLVGDRLRLAWDPVGRT
jgi:peptide/nickel transport system permease protein